MTPIVQKFLQYMGSKILVYGGQFILDLINKWFKNKKEEKAKKEMEAVVNNPDKSADEKGEALEKYFNN